MTLFEVCRRLRPALLVAAVLLFSAAPPARPAAITFNTALPVTQGQGILRVQWKYAEFGDDPTPLDRQLTVQAIPVVGVWGVTPNLALFAIAPLVDKELELTTPAGRTTRGVSGLADLTLLACYTAYQRDEPGKTFRLAPFLGVEAPTGTDDDQDALGRLPQPLQLGSGSWDFKLGTIATRQTLRWQIDTSVSYQLNTEANDFEHGDEARLDFSYQRRLIPRQLSGGVPAFLYGVIESNLIWQDRSRLAGVDNPDTGGTTWYLAPGLQYVRRRLVLEGAVQILVSKNLNGAALENDFMGTLSMRINL